ncbi:selenoprotein V-like [Schistocerca serialis cubense]|uniref:selenoprotein V-like n=1 Tax=Schistocerca serialis cubense TaxID=2023355 RepID=UPI00214F1894|nr:selenoprotein V-like [Schistocerca serialis cubense]
MAAGGVLWPRGSTNVRRPPGRQVGFASPQPTPSSFPGPAAVPNPGFSLSFPLLVPSVGPMLLPSPQLVGDLPGNDQQLPAASPAPPPPPPDLGQPQDLPRDPLPSPSSVPSRLDDADVPMPLAQPIIASQPPPL